MRLWVIQFRVFFFYYFVRMHNFDAILTITIHICFVNWFFDQQMNFSKKKTNKISNKRIYRWSVLGKLRSSETIKKHSFNPSVWLFFETVIAIGTGNSNIERKTRVKISKSSSIRSRKYNFSLTQIDEVNNATVYFVVMCLLFRQFKNVQVVYRLVFFRGIYSSPKHICILFSSILFLFCFCFLVSVLLSYLWIQFTPWALHIRITNVSIINTNTCYNSIMDVIHQNPTISFYRSVIKELGNISLLFCFADTNK